MSFRLKTILGIAFIEVILLSVLVASSLNVLRTSNEAGLQQKASDLAEVFAATTKDALISYDMANLEDFTEEVGRRQGLTFIQVFDAEGRLLADRHNENSADLVKNLIEARAKVTEGGETFGTVVIGLHRGYVDILLEKTRNEFILIAIIGVTLTGLFSLLLGNYLTRRLVLLQRASHAVAEGKLGYQVPVKGGDELAQTGSDFNRMSSRLKTLYDEQASREGYIRTVMENVVDGIITIDASGTIQTCNRSVEAIFGYSPDELEGANVSILMPEPYRSQHDGYLTHFAETGEAHIIGTGRELIGRHKDGTEFPLELSISEMHLAERRMFVGIVRNISERKEAEKGLKLGRQVFESAGEAILITDPAGNIIDVNPAYLKITGYNREEVIGINPNRVSSGHHDNTFYKEMWHDINTKGEWSGEIWDRRKNGESFPKWLTISSIKDGDDKVSHYVGIFSDITEQKDAEERLERLAYYDPLTHLPNRSLFQERLERELIQSERHNRRMALMFLDLDRFKHVNDTLGHAFGDHLLAQVALRVRECLRSTDTVARLGGDEFTVILSDVNDQYSIGRVAQKIIDTLKRPFNIEGNEVFIGASIGIGIYPNDGTNRGDLAKHADIAMYEAKSAGRGNYQFFTPAMNANNLKRIQVEHGLRTALDKDELILHYQPKLELESDKVCGMEALLRWQHPKRGMISPVDFIPIAEETGIIVPIGEWVIQEGCKQLAAWSAQEGSHHLKLALNLSARQFQDRDLIKTLDKTLEATGIDPECLELEITESMIMDNMDEAITIMKRLRKRGVKWALDDFGTGYSSLSYLKKLPINALKIDQSFVRDLTVDSTDVDIVRAILSLGKTLDLRVVAEGVETEEQLDFLRQHGCHEIQGYLIAKPLPSVEFERAFVSGRTQLTGYK
ncbi:MAG: EAL domain-containing protein [Sedimenticola sp.]